MQLNSPVWCDVAKRLGASLADDADYTDWKPTEWVQTVLNTADSVVLATDAAGMIR